jgi:hypothetical protein
MSPSQARSLHGLDHAERGRRQEWGRLQTSDRPASAGGVWQATGACRREIAFVVGHPGIAFASPSPVRCESTRSATLRRPVGEGTRGAWQFPADPIRVQRADRGMPVAQRGSQLDVQVEVAAPPGGVGAADLIGTHSRTISRSRPGVLRQLPSTRCRARSRWPLRLLSGRREVHQLPGRAPSGLHAGCVPRPHLGFTSE